MISRVQAFRRYLSCLSRNFGRCDPIIRSIERRSLRPKIHETREFGSLAFGVPMRFSRRRTQLILSAASVERAKVFGMKQRFVLFPPTGTCASCRSVDFQSVRPGSSTLSPNECRRSKISLVQGGRSGQATTSWVTIEKKRCKIAAR